MIALAAAAAGDRVETERLMAPLTETTGGPPEASVVPAAVRAMLALSTNDVRAANAVLDPAVAPVLAHLSTAPLHQFGLWALLRTVTDDRGEEARRALAAVPVSRRRANAAALRYADAVVAGAAGRLADAEAAFRDAEELAAATPWVRRLLRTVVLPRLVADGWGDPVPVLRASLAEHEQAGEEALARIVRDLLRRAGAPTRRGRGNLAVPTPWLPSVSPAARPTCSPCSSRAPPMREIAERLFLSRRTVETHVAHLLQKTSSASRAELRSRVAELDS